MVSPQLSPIRTRRGREPESVLVARIILPYGNDGLKAAEVLRLAKINKRDLVTVRRGGEEQQIEARVEGVDYLFRSIKFSQVTTAKGERELHIFAAAALPGGKIDIEGARTEADHLIACINLAISNKVEPLPLDGSTPAPAGSRNGSSRGPR